MSIIGNKQNQGAALLLAILMIAFLIAISAAVFISQLQQLRFATREGVSLVAIAAADAGIEEALYQIKQTGIPDECTTSEYCYVPGTGLGTLLGGSATYGVFVLEKNDIERRLILRSIGSFQGIKRSLQIEIGI